MASVKLEVGKFYRTRDGRKVGPMEKKGWEDGYPWTADNVFNYFDDEGMGQNPALTLIAEWTEAPTTTTVRTVTRKEIVPGLYGNVYVEKYEGQLGASMEFTAEPAVIRAAIATLTEIADAMDAQK